MFQLHPVSHGDVEKAAGKSGRPIGNFCWIYLDFGHSPSRGKEGDRIGLFRKFDVSLLNIRVGSTHVLWSFLESGLFRDRFIDTSE